MNPNLMHELGRSRHDDLTRHADTHRLAVGKTSPRRPFTWSRLMSAHTEKAPLARRGSFCVDPIRPGKGRSAA